MDYDFNKIKKSQMSPSSLAAVLRTAATMEEAIATNSLSEGDFLALFYFEKKHKRRQSVEQRLLQRFQTLRNEREKRDLLSK